MLLSLAAIIYPLSQAGLLGYWYDELWSIDAVLGDLPRMLRILAGDVHPPLYHAILWVWVRIFGTEEVATRALSCFALAATVPFVYLLGRRLEIGRWAAAGAAGSVGLCYSSVVFALETRPYTLLILTATVTACCLTGAKTRRDFLVTWFAGLVATAVHYAALFYLLPLALLFALRDRDAKKVWLALAWIVSLAPFLWHIRPQAVLFSTFTWLVTPSWLEINHYLKYAMGELRGSLIFIALLTAAVGTALLRREFKRHLWLLTVPIVVAAVIAVSYVVQPIFHVRYLYALQPWIFFLGAYLIDRLPRLELRAVGALVLLGLVTASTARLPVIKTEDWRAAADYVRERRTNESLIVTAGSRLFRVYFPGIEILDEEDVGAAQIWLAKQAGKSFWMLQGRSFAGTPVRRFLADNSDLVDMKEFSGSRALLLRVRP